jgi:signal transduction histidine kinase
MMRLASVPEKAMCWPASARLTPDMHDGLGSMLSHALEELRITLDSLEPMVVNCPPSMGTLRQRISPTLEAMGIELDWDVQEVPAVLVNGVPMETRAVMHLFRCVREVVANTINHAKATRLTVRTGFDTQAPRPQVWLRLADNCIGIGEGVHAGGRGMDNLRARAHALGATFRIEPNAEAGRGTAVTLLFAAASPEGQDLTVPRVQM